MPIDKTLITRKINLISEDLKKLAPLARIAKSRGLRNRLAHEYNGIDTKKVYQAVKRCFIDLPVYLNKITDFLNLKQE